MLMKLLGLSILSVALGLVIGVAPELWSAEEKATQQVRPIDQQRLVRACVREAEEKLEAMGPFYGWDPDEVRQKCRAAVEERMHVSD